MTPALQAMAKAICRELNKHEHQWAREAPSLEAFVEVAWPSYAPAARAGVEAIQIEVLARAMCASARVDPDKLVYITPEGHVVEWPGPKDRRVALWTLGASDRVQPVFDAILKDTP